MASSNMNSTTDRDSHFTIGLLMGACAGAALTMWLAPRATAEIRERFADFTRTVGDQAAAQYQDASNRVNEAMDTVSSAAESARNDVADAVSRGAKAVESQADAAKK